MPRSAHDAIALGPPSVLSTWAFDLLREVCALIPDSAAIRAIDRQDILEPDGDRVPLVYLSHFPSPSLLAECGTGNAPILLCLDDPVDSVRYLQQGSNVTLVEALRLQTAAAASYARLRGNPRLLILHRLVDAPTGELLDAILNHFRLNLACERHQSLRVTRLGPKGRDSDLESSLQSCIGGSDPVWAKGNRHDRRRVVAAHPDELKVLYTDRTTNNQTLLTVVPAPSTWFMMILGFAAVGFAGYCRRRVGRAFRCALIYSGLLNPRLDRFAITSLVTLAILRTLRPIQAACPTISLAR